MTELVSYLNGRLVPHSQAVAELSESDIGSAGGFYDAERTFNGQVFKLHRHLERLYGTLDCATIDPGMSLEAMEEATLEVLEANRPSLGDEDEFFLSQVVTLGARAEAGANPPVNVMIFCELIDFSSFAWSYASGVRITTPVTHAAPPQRGAGGKEQPAQQTFNLMTDAEGNVTECQHANLFFTKDGRIKLPSRRSVLPGISMETVLELAESLEIPVDEGDYSTYDVYLSDEAFISSTGFCLLPVATINGMALGTELPGVVTKRVIQAWCDLVGVDFVGQALKRLPVEDIAVSSEG